MRPLTPTSPERVAIAVALALLVLHAAGVGDALEYRRAALVSEPWRALGGHVVHIGWVHAIVNATALWVVARLYAPDLDTSRQVLALVVSALGVSAALYLFAPSIDWYRGFSGALHGLYFTGAATWLWSRRSHPLRRVWLPATLFVGGWVKVLLEQPAGSAMPYAEWLGSAVVPQAHLAGAACGSLLGALFAAPDSRGQQQSRQE